MYALYGLSTDLYSLRDMCQPACLKASHAGKVCNHSAWSVYRAVTKQRRWSTVLASNASIQPVGSWCSFHIRQHQGRKTVSYLFSLRPGCLERRFKRLILSVQHRDPFRKLLHLLLGSSLPFLPNA